MNINLDYYKVFYIVAKNGSITNGANELHISQPAVSRVLKTLEDQIGVKLFIRIKKGIKLTNEGRELYNQIGESIENILKGELVFQKLINLKTLKICVDSNLLNYYFLPRLWDNKIDLSNISFLNTYDFSDLNKNLLNHLVDCAIITKNDYFKFDSALQFKEVTKLHICLVSQNKIIISKTSDLEQYNFILQEEGNSFRKLVNPLLENNSIAMQKTIIVDNYDSISFLIKFGYGIGFVIEEFIEEELKNKKLFKIEPSFEMPIIPVGLLIHEDNVLNPMIINIINIFKK